MEFRSESKKCWEKRSWASSQIMGGRYLVNQSNFSIIYIRYCQHCIIENNVCVCVCVVMSVDYFMPLHVLAFCLASTVTSASMLISV